jgi:DNA-binding transcriptional regulator YiaG
MTHPTPQQIKAARRAAGLTQTQAGALIGVSKRTWVAWECDKNKPSYRNMPYAKWELFLLKIAPTTE